MSNSEKRITDQDMHNSLRYSFNDVSKSLETNSFIFGRVGRKITQSISTTTVPNDTLTYTYLENALTLFSIKVIYTDDTYETLLSVERIS